MQKNILFALLCISFFNNTITSDTEAQEVVAGCCTICLDPFTEPFQLACSHTFDKLCIKRAVLIKTTCPICRKAIPQKDLKKLLTKEEQRSAKTKQRLIEISHQADANADIHREQIRRWMAIHTPLALDVSNPLALTATEHQEASDFSRSLELAGQPQ